MRFETGEDIDELVFEGFFFRHVLPVTRSTLKEYHERLRGAKKSGAGNYQVARKFGT